MSEINASRVSAQVQYAESNENGLFSPKKASHLPESDRHEVQSRYLGGEVFPNWKERLVTGKQPWRAAATLVPVPSIPGPSSLGSR